MQITIACVSCAKRFLTDDKSLAQELVCPACGGAMKSAPQMNLKHPTKTHIPTYDPFWKDLPPASAAAPMGDHAQMKKIMVYGGIAAGAILLGGIGWIFLGGESKKPPAVAYREPAPLPKEPAPVAMPDAPTTEIAAVPVFAPLAPPPPVKAGRAKKSVADLIEAEGDGVVHVSVIDGHGVAYGTGSGVIIARRKIEDWIEPDTTKDRKPPVGDLWLVATNYHVVAGAAGAVVRLRDGTTREVRGLAAVSRERDLAILALDAAPPKLKVLEPLSGAMPRQGEEVMAIGHPKGFDFTVSTGIISAIRSSKELPEDVAESVHAPEDQQWVQTTAAITNGNSGGPLMAMTGEVVGINTWGINAGGNLAFASHVKHLVELLSKTVEPDVTRPTVRLQPFSVAKPLTVLEKIADKSDWLESQVREELARSAKRAIAIDWRPTSKGDYFSFQAVATMLAVSAVQRFDVSEVKPVADSLAKRKWDFESEVRQINRFAVENLDEGQWGVFFFGKVRRINQATQRNLWVDLTGRGIVVAVTIPANQPPPEVKVGDDIAVLGYRIGLARENNRLPRGAHDILAGLILPVTLPTVPEDTALQAAYDLVKYDREDQGFEQAVRKFATAYERVIPLIGKAAVRWQRLQLNTRGRQFDAVRFSVPPGLNGDLIWSFNSPEDAIDEWGVLPVEDFPMRVIGNTFTFQGIPVPLLSKDESQHVKLQCVTGGLLVPDQDYLLWFSFKNQQPRRMAIAVRVVPAGSFDARSISSMGQAMKDGAPFSPDEMNRMLKAQKDKSAAAEAKPQEPKPN